MTADQGLSILVQNYFNTLFSECPRIDRFAAAPGNALRAEDILDYYLRKLVFSKVGVGRMNLSRYNLVNGFRAGIELLPMSRPKINDEFLVMTKRHFARVISCAPDLWTADVGLLDDVERQNVVLTGENMRTIYDAQVADESSRLVLSTSRKAVDEVSLVPYLTTNAVASYVERSARPYTASQLVSVAHGTQRYSAVAGPVAKETQKLRRVESDVTEKLVSPLPREVIKELASLDQRLVVHNALVADDATIYLREGCIGFENGDSKEFAGILRNAKNRNFDVNRLMRFVLKQVKAWNRYGVSKYGLAAGTFFSILGSNLSYNPEFEAKVTEFRTKTQDFLRRNESSVNILKDVVSRDGRIAASDAYLKAQHLYAALEQLNYIFAEKRLMGIVHGARVDL